MHPGSLAMRMREGEPFAPAQTQSSRRDVECSLKDLAIHDRVAARSVPRAAGELSHGRRDNRSGTARAGGRAVDRRGFHGHDGLPSGVAAGPKWNDTPFGCP